MECQERKILDATLSLYDLTDRIKALKASFEECEPVKAWRDEGLKIALGEAEPSGGAEPNFCAKAWPLYQTYAPNPYEMGRRYLEGKEAAEFIAAHWCPACQRNSPKVVEWRRLKKTVAAAKARVTMAVRRYRAAKEGAK